MSDDPWDKIVAEAKEGTFPGGGAAPRAGELRIAIDKKPYADMIGHAIEEPDVELCGVMVGYLRRDAQGPFVHIASIIRGEKAKQEGAQVTFTHETWDHIHSVLDADPDKDRRILGWYHTHGGFGIFLSEMDRFIHENFFPEPFHLAYVYDPLAGSEGFFRKAGDELVQAERYWIGGKPRKVFTRAEPESEAPASPSGGDAGDLRAAVGALNRTVAGLQSSLPDPRGEESSISLAVLALAVGVGFLAGMIVPGSRQGSSASAETRPRPVVVVHHDKQTGRKLGLEVFPIARTQGSALPLYRDARGERFYGVELQAIDSSTRVLADAVPAAVEKAVGPKPRGPRRGPRQEAAGGPGLLLIGGGIALVLAIFAAAGLLIARGGRSRT